MSKTWFVLTCPSSCNGANQHMLCDPQQQFLSATCWHWKLRTSLDRTPCNWHGKMHFIESFSSRIWKMRDLKISYSPRKKHEFICSFCSWLVSRHFPHDFMAPWGCRVPSHSSKRLRPGHPWTLAAAQSRRELPPGRRNRSPAWHGKYHWEWGDLWISMDIWRNYSGNVRSMGDCIPTSRVEESTTAVRDPKSYTTKYCTNHPQPSTTESGHKWDTAKLQSSWRICRSLWVQCPTSTPAIENLSRNHVGDHDIGSRSPLVSLQLWHLPRHRRRTRQSAPAWISVVQRSEAPEASVSLPSRSGVNPGQKKATSLEDPDLMLWIFPC